MTVYGYLRVSTDKQDISNNKAGILNFANDRKLGNVEWIEETVSGRKNWRERLLGKKFDQMKSGDVIITTEVSRIGRDKLTACLEFIAECTTKGVKVYSTSGDIPEFTGVTADILLILRSSQAMAEREDISRRTKAGLARTKAQGTKLGRPDTLKLEKKDNIDITEESKAQITTMMKEGVKNYMIAKRLGCHPTTLRKFIKKYNLKANDK